MRESNRKVVLYLLEKGYTEIWLKAHTRRHDLIYGNKDNWYRCIDLWNLFDGICIDPCKNIIFLQMKTNSWAKEQPLLDWTNKIKNSKVMSFNIKYSTTLKSWSVLERTYEDGKKVI
jgi:hypothetical protein